MGETWAKVVKQYQLPVVSPRDVMCSLVTREQHRPVYLEVVERVDLKSSHQETTVTM